MMKKKQLTQEQEEFFRRMGAVIDHDLANLLKDYSLEQIMRAQILTEIDEHNLSLTVEIRLAQK